jgi:hypothetical protein
MKYLYEESLNGLKDLKHIEWFLNHHSDYEFKTAEAKDLLNSLLYKIQKKNVFYSEIVEEYYKLISLFENNPFNYKYDVLDKNRIVGMQTNKKNNYFINVTDKEGNKYVVPYQYIIDNSVEHNLTNVNNDFNQKLLIDRTRVRENFDSLNSHYLNYWESGVNSAIERYQKVKNGEDYHIFSTIIHCILYNFILFRCIYFSQFINVITHFWQILSTSKENTYSAYNVFSGHTYIGIVVIILVAYFIYLDFYYLYGLYYILFVNRKYSKILNHHKEVLTSYEMFKKDYNEINSIPLENQIVKFNHRNSVYIPLISKTSRRYNFYQEKTVKNKEGKSEKVNTLIDVKVPYNQYYSNPISKQYIKIIALLALIEAISSLLMIN